ncbi:hypothetical protein FQR15_18570, partial [Salmonella enterica]|nr:hypothetical protein [Salmonella enterica]ECJ9879156.1 hypothetical protein [Salmonella enterica]ECY2430049.1 hypothetical protein [Salmonella enterica]ECZ4690135.1 hypothetical protein [Salmonella enterica]
YDGMRPSVKPGFSCQAEGKNQGELMLLHHCEAFHPLWQRGIANPNGELHLRCRLSRSPERPLNE